MKKNILFILFFHLFFFASAQDYVYDIKNFSAQLDDNQIVDFLLDNERNFWISGSKNIVKYDGGNTIKFIISSSGRKISDINLVHDKFLLIHYKDGSLGQFDIKDYTYTDLPNMKCLAVFSYKGLVYTLLPGYVVKIYKWSDLAKPITILKIGKGYNFIKEVSHHQIYVNDDGLFLSIPLRGIYLIKNKKYFPLLTGYRLNNSFNRLEKFVEINGVLHYTGLPSIYYFNREKKRLDIAHRFDVYNGDRIAELFDDKNCTIYSDRNSNFLKIISKSTGRKTKLNFLELYKLVKIGNQFVVSTRDGLVFVRKNDIETGALNYKELDNLLIKRKVLETEKHLVFTGYPNILTIDKQSKKLQKHILPKYFPTISDIVDTPKGFFAATEGRGLAQISHDFKLKIMLSFDHPIFDKKLYGVYYDVSNHYVYAGGSRFVYFFNLDKNKYQYIKRFNYDFGEVRNINKIVNSDKLVINSIKGAFLYDVKKNTVCTLLKNILTTSSFIDYYNKKLWISSEHRVYLFDLKNLNKCKIINLKNLSNPISAAFLQDNYRNIWISTFSGVVKIKPDGSDYSIYDRTNDLKNSEFNYKSNLKLKNGQLIFGGVDGYDIFSPKQLYFPKRRIVIKDYSIMGKNMVIKKYDNKPIIYGFDQFNCKINFSTNCLSNKNCTFKYNIDNGNWIKIKDQTNLSLVGIAPGKYNVKIAGVDEKERSIPPVTVLLEVTEPLYKTKLFLIITVIILFCAIIAIIYFAVKRGRVREETIREISMDLHDEVGTILTKTKLMFEITDVTDEKNRLKIKNNLEQISFSLRTYINSAGQKKNDLSDLYYKCVDILMQMTDLKGIKLSNEIILKQPVTITNGQYRDMLLCVYEIINNITKYAVTDSLIFDITEDKDFIIITFITNENSKFFEDKHSGNGLRNIERRTKRNKGVFKIFEKNNNIYFILTFHK